MAIRIGIDLVGAMCGIVLLLRAHARVVPGVVTGMAGRTAILFLGSVAAVSLGVSAPNCMPDLAAAILLITTLALTRGKVELFAQPSDRLAGMGRVEVEQRSSTRLFWMLLAVGLPAYFGIAFAIGSPPL